MDEFRILNFRNWSPVKPGCNIDEYIVFCDDPEAKAEDYARPGFRCVADIHVEADSVKAATLPMETEMVRDD